MHLAGSMSGVCCIFFAFPQDVTFRYCFFFFRPVTLSSICPANKTETRDTKHFYHLHKFTQVTTKSSQNVCKSFIALLLIAWMYFVKTCFPTTQYKLQSARCTSGTAGVIAGLQWSTVNLIDTLQIRDCILLIILCCGAEKKILYCYWTECHNNNEGLKQM